MPPSYNQIHCNIQRIAIVTLALAFLALIIKSISYSQFRITLDLISCYKRIPHIS